MSHNRAEEGGSWHCCSRYTILLPGRLTLGKMSSINCEKESQLYVVMLQYLWQLNFGAYHAPSFGSLFKKNMLFLRTFSKGGEGGSCFLSWYISPLWQSFRLKLETGKECKYKGRVTPPKRMNFLKSSKRPLTPPPIFQKIMLQIFHQYHAQKALFKDPKSAT